MTSKFDTLNDEFNVKGDIVQSEVVNDKIEKIKETSDDIKKDYTYTRGNLCLLYTSPSPRDATLSRMPSSA